MIEKFQECEFCGSKNIGHFCRMGSYKVVCCDCEKPHPWRISPVGSILPLPPNSRYDGLPEGSPVTGGK